MVPVSMFLILFVLILSPYEVDGGLNFRRLDSGSGANDPKNGFVLYASTIENTTKDWLIRRCTAENNFLVRERLTKFKKLHTTYTTNKMKSTRKVNYTFFSACVLRA